MLILRERWVGRAVECTRGGRRRRAAGEGRGGLTRGLAVAALDAKLAQNRCHGVVVVVVVVVGGIDGSDIAAVIGRRCVRVVGREGGEGGRGRGRERGQQRERKVAVDERGHGRAVKVFVHVDDIGRCRRGNHRRARSRLLEADDAAFAGGTRTRRGGGSLQLLLLLEQVVLVLQLLQVVVLQGMVVWRRRGFGGRGWRQRGRRAGRGTRVAVKGLVVDDQVCRIVHV